MKSTAALVVRCERTGETVPSLSENESYSLDVTDKQARLVAPTVVGALRGLETFLQLLQGDREGYYLPGIKIQDQPRFPWRGLLIDVGRHYEPLEVLKRISMRWRGKVERLSLAPDRRPGVPRREQEISEAPHARVRRSFLHPGPGA